MDGHKTHPHHKKLIIGLEFFITEVLVIVKSPVFILLTVLGNSLIGLFSLIFYAIESSVNPSLKGFIDALWWGFATATTTGYGDVTPVATIGKMLGILLMLCGTALFAMFTALFAEAILLSSKKLKL